MLAFQYKPLTAPDSIRLLVLKPGLHEEELHCSLVHTTISHCDCDIARHYIAISYVWGDLTKQKEIHVEGIPVSIGVNLEAALRDIRDETDVVRVWADALCVNQLDLEERSSQVGLTGKIYSTAHHTIIHLSHDQGQEILQAIPGNKTGDPRSWDHTALLRRAKKSLLKMPWFSRVWIFQELVLSRNPWIQCGKVRAKWSETCKILLNLDEHKSVSKEMQMLKDMDDARRKERQDLIHYLVTQRGLGATDPGDMVFAHLSIASDAARVERHVKVDYTTSCVQLYNEIALYLLQEYGAEAIFRLATDITRKNSIEGLASWAPDWTVASVNPSLLHPTYNREPGLTFREHFCYLDVAGTPVLGCLGLEVGEISAISLLFPNVQKSEGIARESDRQLWIDWVTRHYGDEEKQKELLSDVVTELMKIMSDELPLISPENDHHSLQVHQDFMSILRDLVNGLRIGPSPLEQDYRRGNTEYEGEDVMQARMLEHFSTMRLEMRDGLKAKSVRLGGRRVAITTCGLLSCASEQMRVGDSIVYFPGCAQPFVIRAIDKAVELNRHQDEQFRTLTTQSMDHFHAVDVVEILDSEIKQQSRPAATRKGVWNEARERRLPEAIGQLPVACALIAEHWYVEDDILFHVLWDPVVKPRLYGLY